MKNVAIVTGASSGMGARFAWKISKRYPNIDEIWLIARRCDRLLKLASKIETKCKVFPIDLTKEDGVNIIKKQLEEDKPFISILVNASGFGMIGEVSELSYDVQSEMIQLNCLALTQITKIVLPFMKRGSQIIEFGSSAAFLAQPKFAVYAATKAYVKSFSRALNKELKKEGIAVTVVCPGPVKTEFFSVAQKKYKTSFLKVLTMADPNKVVKKAIIDSEKAKTMSIYGIPMKALYILTRIVPNCILEWIISISW